MKHYNFEFTLTQSERILLKQIFNTVKFDLERVKNTIPGYDHDYQSLIERTENLKDYIFSNSVDADEHK